MPFHSLAFSIKNSRRFILYFFTQQQAFLCDNFSPEKRREKQEIKKVFSVRIQSVYNVAGCLFVSVYV